MYHYTGSMLSIDWTNQHSCGGPNCNCEIIIQYMCADRIRDGTDDRTIPISPEQCYNLDCDTDVRYGRHENFDFYMNCLQRSRNKGLFTANQNLRGVSARYTRQNPNGDRRGLECPEERDYYPYWATSPWVDIAILTGNPERCTAYRAESENMKPRFSCILPDGYINSRFNKGGYGRGDQGFIPIDKDDCESISWTDANNVTHVGLWTQAPARNLPLPECQHSPWTRDNHLGNGIGGYPVLFNWTIPDGYIGETCVLRLRYNISTGEYPGWASLTSIQSGNATWNQSRPTENTNRHPAPLDVWSKYRLSYTDVQDSFDRNKNDPNDQNSRRNSREYVFKDNPQVDIFGSLTGASKVGSVKLQLAINTDQFGRTFQDRSHTFAIRPRPTNVPFGSILNVNVIGKRGNIVQVYPGTEYDFRPFLQNVGLRSWVHFQWTGSNANPQNNAGQGRAGTDRHNVIALRAPNYFEKGLPTWDSNGNPVQVTNPKTYGQYGNSYPQLLPLNFDRTQESPNTNWYMLGWTYNDLLRLATLQGSDSPVSLEGGNLKELDDAATYFDMGLKQVGQTGIYNYMCTRNNNFSNRSQKSKIVVTTTTTTTRAVDTQGGRLIAARSSVSIRQGALTTLTDVTLASTPSKHAYSSFKGEPASDFVTITPLNWTNLNEPLRVSIDYKENLIGKAKLWRADTMDGRWKEVGGADFGNGVVRFSTTRGGVYVVEDKDNGGVIAGIVIALVVGLAIIAFIVYQFVCKRTSTSGGKTTVAAPAPISSSSSPVAAAPKSDGGAHHTSTSPDAPRDLPPGWQAVTDPKDGATYYVHPTRGLSQWEFPEN